MMWFKPPQVSPTSPLTPDVCSGTNKSPETFSDVLILAGWTERTNSEGHPLLWYFHVFVCCSFLTSSSSSSSSTSRMPESCSDSGLPPCPPLSVPAPSAAAAAAASFLPRRLIRALGCVETELSRERCNWAWSTKQEKANTGQTQPTGADTLLNLLCFDPTWVLFFWTLQKRKESLLRLASGATSEPSTLFDFEGLTPKPDVYR